MDKALWVNRCCRTARHEKGCDRGRIAKGALGDARSELIEEGVADTQAVEDAFSAEIAVGENGGRAIGVNDLGPARLDESQRLVPGDACIGTAALGPGTPLVRS